MASSSELQKWIALEKEETRAKHDDQVLVVIVNVKEASKVAFDAWVKDVLYAALYKSESEMKKAQLKTTRWLEPIRQNKNGTWTYSWIMDPNIPNTNYDILPFLKEMYGDELGAEHWGDYLSYMASEPLSVIFKQSDY